MPYLSTERKANLDKDGALYSAGDLTYLLYRATLDWHGDNEENFWAILGHRIQRFLGTEPPRYQDYAEVLGALTATAMEIARRGHGGAGNYRSKAIIAFTNSYYLRVIGPYEDTKIEQNGDVT